MITFDHLSVLSKCESDQRFHGLSKVEKDYSWSGWPFGGSETGMESSATKDHPPPPFFFGSYCFFFGPDSIFDSDELCSHFNMIA